MPALYPIAKSHALAHIYNRLMTWYNATFSQVNARIWFLPKNTLMYVIPHEKRPQTAMSAGVKRLLAVVHGLGMQVMVCQAIPGNLLPACAGLAIVAVRIDGDAATRQ